MVNMSCGAINDFFVKVMKIKKLQRELELSNIILINYSITNFLVAEFPSSVIFTIYTPGFKPDTLIEL